jgi:hypothetical protein
MQYVAQHIAGQVEREHAAAVVQDCTDARSSLPATLLAEPACLGEAATEDAPDAGSVGTTAPAYSDEAMFAAHAATRVYCQGFAHGADPRRARAHTVHPHTDIHWRRGFHAGRAAAGAAERAFFTGMLRGRAP